MEKRIILELRGRSPSQVEELNLDNSRTNQIDGLTDEYTNLKILSLNNVGLTTLKGFPTLPSLRKLELSDNRISNGLNFLKGCKKLSHLNLSGNKIKTLDTLKPLEEFENLRNLDLFNNDVTSIDDYRVKVFALLPLLKYLDGFDQEDREVEDSSVEDEDEQNGNDDSASESEDSEDGEEGDISLSAVYNEHLEEETSGGSLYDGSDDDIEDDEDDDEDNDERFGEQNNKTRDGEENADAAPEESTRGKKRKHESEEEDNN